MVENPFRKFAFVLVLVVGGALALWFNDFRLGLDLEGGTRFVYSVDIDQAKKDGKLAPDAQDSEVLDTLITIISKRIDPNGVLDASISKAGETQILIEIPGLDKESTAEIQRRIEELGRLEMRMVAAERHSEQLKGLDLEAEKKVLDAWLRKNKESVEKDPLAIHRFNALSSDEGGAVAGNKKLKWMAMYRQETPEWQDGNKTGKQWRYETHAKAHSLDEGPGPFFLPIDWLEPFFRGQDLDGSATYATTDGQSGMPAIGYSMRPSRAGDYAAWSKKHKDYHSAIILNDWVRVAPVFLGTISGAGQITGGFSQDEVKELVLVLKTGSLDVKPQLESQVTIGAMLGAAAIESGVTSIAVGGLFVLLFMLFYYRLAGVIACMALSVNIFLVMGALAFIKATITLPGLAGIVLTIGMAVDANILIFERIREEKDRGKDVLRSIEAGFAKAMPTILDANITTFLTGLILYNVGIGPIKGFAVTLMLGIVTSVFSALFVSKLAFHAIYGGKKRENLKMARLFATPNFQFLKLRKPAALLSILMVTAGLLSFYTTDRNIKYAIDFTGGAAMRVALRAPATQQEILDLLRNDKEFSAEFENPMVTTVGDVDRDGKASQFSIKLKLSEDQRIERGERGGEAPYSRMIRALLAKKLAPDPYSEARISREEEGYTEVEVYIHSTTDIPILAIREKLEAATYLVHDVVARDEVTKEKFPDKLAAKTIFVALQLEKDTSRGQVPLRFDEALKGLEDVEGNKISLSKPIPEDSLIGSKAVGDLTNAAISSIVLSLLIIVIYIRVRFHEYKYGIAACVALIHDVCIVLGIIVLLNKFGIIHAEIDLAMIAAFLTIIGYSLNDTIVVFDRIRENLDISKKLGTGAKDFDGIVDRSVNQVLARTVLTSVTTFVVVGVIFAFNKGSGSVLEGFSFAMMIGVVVGTYSSIFVANPIVVALHKRDEQLAG